MKEKEFDLLKKHCCDLVGLHPNIVCEQISRKSAKEKEQLVVNWTLQSSAIKLLEKTQRDETELLVCRGTRPVERQTTPAWGSHGGGVGQTDGCFFYFVNLLHINEGKSGLLNLFSEEHLPK